MTSAIERVEESDDLMPYGPPIDPDDLTEVLRLAKLGERVEQCEGHADLYGAGRDYVTVEAKTFRRAVPLLAWLKGEQ